MAKEKLPNPYPLKYPLQTKDGQTLTELKLRPLTIGDLESIETETNAKTRAIKTLAMSADISADDARKIMVSDFEKASDVVVDLMGF